MAAAVAAIVARKERDVVRRFTDLRATSPDDATDLDRTGVDPHDIGFRALRRRAVIREAGPGLFYLDVPSWEALLRTRHRIAWVMVVLVLVLLFFALS